MVGSKNIARQQPGDVEVVPDGLSSLQPSGISIVDRIDSALSLKLGDSIWIQGEQNLQWIHDTASKRHILELNHYRKEIDKRDKEANAMVRRPK